MTAVRLFVCVVVGALAIGCGGGGGKKEVRSLAPRVYIDRALALMRSHAVYTPRAGWSAVQDEATKVAASAKTAAETYPAIEYAIAQLRRAGDLHAGFSNPSEAKSEHRPNPWAQRTPPPTVSLAAPRIGRIDVPWISTPPESRHSHEYAASALAGIASLQRSQRPCGWIVDLRGNLGGDMYPMLLSLGPILGSGIVIGFTDKRGAHSWVSYRNNTLSSRWSGRRYTHHAPVRVADFGPAPAVAVLTGPNTVSSGEAVTIAFRGRAQTRSFGATTAGATGSPETYRLADGATVSFATTVEVDRHGNVYWHAITPDVRMSAEVPEDRVLSVATRWLRSTPACRKEP